MSSINACLLSAIKSVERLDKFNIKGRVISASAYRVEIVGCRVAIGDRCELVDKHNQIVPAEVIMLDGDRSVLMPYGDARGVITGSPVYRSDSLDEVEVGDPLLSRVVDGLGLPIDGKGPITLVDHQSIEGEKIGPMFRAPIEKPFDTGVSALNGFLTIGVGQRIGLVAGSGVGKSVLLAMMTKHSAADVVVVGLIGERGREVREFIEDTLDEDALQRAVVVAATAEQSPLLRIKAAKRCTAIAEHFRDQGKSVLLLMDSLSRYAMAWREVGIATNENGIAKGYTASAFSELSKLVERAGNGKEGSGSITAIYTLLAEGDDENDPIVDSARSFLDGHVVLCREHAQRGHYPAIDVLKSISRCMDKVTDEEHLALAIKIRRVLAKYRAVEELLPLGVYEEGADPETDQAVAFYPQIVERLLTQSPGIQIDLDNTLEAMQGVGNELKC